jgi:hypothetical protein
MNPNVLACTALLGLLVAATATACRMLLVIGLVAFARMDRPNPVRFIGALGTHVAWLGLGGAVFMR